MNRPLLVRGGTVVTLGENCQVLPEHDILVEKGFIKSVVPTGTLSGEGCRILPAEGKAVLPGFINAHTHFYSALVRGLGKAAPSRDFREVLENLWWRLDRKLTLPDSRSSARVALADAVRAGTTTLLDHHASPGGVRGSLDVLASAVGEAGVRASLCYEVSDRDGADIAREGLEENAAFLRRCRSEGSPFLRGHFGLHASFTIGEKTLARAVEMAAETGAGMHVHVAEAASDQEACMAEHGVRVVERFRRAGVLGPRTIAAHCIHVDEAEMDILAETGTTVVVNTQSNLNNAVGIADMVGFAERGVKVGLGTDAMTYRMGEELRVALWAQHHRRQDPCCGFVECVRALTVENARLASGIFGFPLGVIQEGAAGDLAVLPYLPPTPLEDSTAWGHLVFGLSQAPVEATVVAGEVLMENFRLVRIDEAELAEEARRRTRDLWERF